MITIEKAVLELVLDALQHGITEMNHRGSAIKCMPLHIAAKALREAVLTQRAAQPTYRSPELEQLILDRLAQKAQPAAQPTEPAGEPVGVVVATAWNADGITTRYATSFRESAALKAGDMVYTRPAVPLTDEQIEALFKGVDSEDKGRFSIVRGFARAVEAAHGIAP